MNAFQISAGSAARDGSPLNSVSIGRSSFGYPTHTGDRELGRVSHEPGVGVVVVRARLPGRGAVGELRALARALLDDPLEDRRHRRRCGGRGTCRATGSLSTTLPLFRSERSAPTRGRSP